MSVLVKICGITRVADAAAAATLGADMIGLNFWPASKRFVEAENAARLSAAARAVNPSVKIVGVFVNASSDELEAASACADLDWFQFHGDESAEAVGAAGPRAFKAVSVRAIADVTAALAYPGELLLLDAPTPGYGGQGVSFDWEFAAPLAGTERTWLLAGGLNPGNVAKAIEVAAPWGVDVASGVESAPGVKDEEKMAAFIAAAKGTTIDVC